MKIYIIGPASQTDHQTQMLFDAAATEIYSESNHAIDPSKLEEMFVKDKQLYTRTRIRLLIRANSVHVVKGWEKDELAKAELFIALLLKMPVHFAAAVEQPLTLTLSHK